MKYLFLFILFSFLSASGYAQSVDMRAETDSLLKVLPGIKNDTQRLLIYEQLAFDGSMVDPDKGIEYAGLQLELAKKMKWKKAIAIAYGGIGQNYSSKGDYVNALKNMLQALQIFQERNNLMDIASSMIIVAQIYDDLHDLPKAFYYDTTALAIYLKLDKRLETVAAYSGMAGVYRDKRNFTEALKYYLRGYTIADSLHNEYEMSGPMGNIGEMYSELGDHNNALRYLFNAVRLNEKLGNTMNTAIYTASIGQVYFIAATDTEGHIKPDSLLSASKAVNLQKAEQYIAKALAMQREYGDVRGVTATLLQLSEVQEARGNTTEALKNYKLYKKYSDSTESTDVRLKVSALETQQQTSMKEKQIELNKLAVAQKKNERIIFAAGLGILLLISAGIYTRFRSQKRTSEMQRATLTQKEMMMKEIHHRVKNNLQVISSLLNMQVVNTNDPQVKEAMTESTTRLKAILLLHQQLYRDDQVASIECSGFVTDLFNQISTVFKKPGQTIKLNNNMTPTLLDIDTGMSLGLIINELVTNSYKYAFNDADGQVTVAIMNSQANEYKLYYQDSGPGLPDILDTKTLKSLGMKIMNSLARQLGGAMHYERDTKRFVITFKDIEGRKMKA